MSRIPMRIIAVLALLLGGTIAHAQLFRTYLSVSGSDANPCTVTLPCRLLPAALNAVADGGEIWILDSANYNTATVNITKSVSILAIPGAVGSVVAVGGPAISIATAGVSVALRNISIRPLPGAGGTAGVVMTTGAGLSIDNSVFADLPGNGVTVLAPAKVRIASSVFRHLGTSSGDAAVSVASGATTEIVDTQISGSTGMGVETLSSTSGQTTSTSINGSTVTGIGNCGIFSHVLTGGAVAQTFVTSTAATGSPSAAICVQGGSTALVSLTGTTIQGNAYGVYFSAGSGVVRVFGNNAISDNGIDVYSGVLTTSALR